MIDLAAEPGASVFSGEQPQSAAGGTQESRRQWQQGGGVRRRALTRHLPDHEDRRKPNETNHVDDKERRDIGDNVPHTDVHRT